MKDISTQCSQAFYPNPRRVDEEISVFRKKKQTKKEKKNSNDFETIAVARFNDGKDVRISVA